MLKSISYKKINSFPRFFQKYFKGTHISLYTCSNRKLSHMKHLIIYIFPLSERKLYYILRLHRHCTYTLDIRIT